MRFIVAINASSPCQAKHKARNLISRWSHENDETVIIKGTSVGYLADGRKRVIVSANVDDQEEDVYLND